MSAEKNKKRVMGRDRQQIEKIFSDYGIRATYCSGKDSKGDGYWLATGPEDDPAVLLSGWCF